MAGKKEKTRRTGKRSSFTKGFDKEKRSMKYMRYFKGHTRKVTKPREVKGNQRNIEKSPKRRKNSIRVPA